MTWADIYRYIGGEKRGGRGIQKKWGERGGKERGDRDMGGGEKREGERKDKTLFMFGDQCKVSLTWRNLCRG